MMPAQARTTIKGLVVLCGLVFLTLGASEFVNSRNLPALTDESGIAALKAQRPPVDEDAREAFLEQWHIERLALEGGKYAAFDKSMFDITAGIISIVCAIAWSSIYNSSGRKRAVLEISAVILAAAGLIGGVVLYSVLEFQRERLNEFADSLAIPIFFGLGALPMILLISIGITYYVGTFLRTRKTLLWPKTGTSHVRFVISCLLFVPIIAWMAWQFFDLLQYRSTAASWTVLLSGAALLLIVISWFQAALTPTTETGNV